MPKFSILQWTGFRAQGQGSSATRKKDASPDSLQKPQSQPIDLEHLRERFADYAKVMVKMFLDDVPVEIAELREFLEEKNEHEIANTAHKLKGVCAVLGAAEMGSLCREIESASNSKDFVAVKAQIEKLEEELETIKQFLSQQNI